MLTVHKFGPAFGLPDASPFVTKVETYLRMTGQPYETVNADVRKAPRGQLPFVEIDGKRVPDSTIIVDQLESARSEKLDAHLDAKQRAVALAFKSLLEEHLYFCMLYMRWATDGGWRVFEPAIRDMLGRMGVPSLMRGMVVKSARKQTVGRVRTQGIGRQPRAEVAATSMKLIDAVAEQLGDSKYFCGDKLTTYDATVYGAMSGILCPAFDNEVTRHARTRKNVVDYTDRMKAAYWKDQA